MKKKFLVFSCVLLALAGIALTKELHCWGGDLILENVEALSCDEQGCPIRGTSRCIPADDNACTITENGTPKYVHENLQWND